MSRPASIFLSSTDARVIQGLIEHASGGRDEELGAETRRLWNPTESKQRS